MDSEDQHVVMEEKLEGKRRKGKGRRKQEKEYKLLRYEELPEYMKENEFIRDYYRAEWPIKNALLSFFSWHNETVNIWTHLLGFLVFLGLTLLHLSRHVPQVAQLLGHLAWSIPTSAVENVSCDLGNFFGEAAAFIKLYISSETAATSSPLPPPAAVRWPFFVFLGGSMFCLLCSSSCHLLCCHSHRLNILLLRMDYVGIAVMIVTSFFPPIHYIFQCDPHWQLTYLVAISAMGFVTVFTLLSPHLSTGKFRAYRALLFSGMGLFGIVPAVHAAVVNWDEPRRNVTLAYEAAMAVSYLTGTVFYVTRVPERWKPGWFDLAGHSHQIFHVFVMAGALSHYGAAVVFLRWRDEVGCGTP
ncbi:heptahelical transmembrane protein ADIPOR1-like [Musa acuminata AAA Group]|uniref:heptahelical transmembrane protein ADIPOR1-like n=1 Tax=Musa acuminata AAA Group TaxID=214697 RepID=UPI0031DE0345